MQYLSPWWRQYLRRHGETHRQRSDRMTGYLCVSIACIAFLFGMASCAWQSRHHDAGAGERLQQAAEYLAKGGVR